MAAVGEALDDLLDGLGDALRLGRHRSGDARILLLNDPDDLPRTGAVDVEARLEAVLAHGAQDIIGNTVIPSVCEGPGWVGGSGRCRHCVEPPPTRSLDYARDDEFLPCRPSCRRSPSP